MAAEPRLWYEYSRLIKLWYYAKREAHGLSRELRIETDCPVPMDSIRTHPSTVHTVIPPILGHPAREDTVMSHYQPIAPPPQQPPQAGSFFKWIGGMFVTALIVAFVHEAANNVAKRF
jgi:hypothetical protein